MTKDSKTGSILLDSLLEKEKRGRVEDEEMTLKSFDKSRHLYGWKNGDTVWSVSLRQTKNILESLVNPNTYKLSNFRRYAKDIEENQYIYGLILVVFGLPLITYIGYFTIKMHNAQSRYYLSKLSMRRLTHQISRKEIQRRSKENFVEGITCRGSEAVHFVNFGFWIKSIDTLNPKILKEKTSI